MPSNPFRYAQTNVQLYGQLLAAGWPEEDLRQVQSAYRLAMKLVAGHFQASEKPLLAHLVGVASILAEHGAHATLVSAGLLHSIYEHGDFGDGGSAVNESRRRTVRQAVGAASEQLVAGYAQFAWTESTLKDLLYRAAHLSPVEETVTWIKLADLLERGAEAESLLAQFPDAAAIAVRLALAFGHDRLAGELKLVARPQLMPEYLLPARENAFAVAPMSHGVRPGVRLVRWLHGLRELLPAGPAIVKRVA